MTNARLHLARWLTSAVSVGLQAVAKLIGKTGARGLERRCNALAHHCVLAFLKRSNRELINRYRPTPAPSGDARGARLAWVMWWQGEEAAPELVRMCLESLRRNLQQVSVRVVTSENVHEYADIGPTVLRRLEAGDLPLTQFSDIVRTALLRKHGGIWMDASIMALRPVPVEVFDAAFYTRKTGQSETFQYVSDELWAAWLIGGSAANPVFGFVNDMFEAYWTRHRRRLRYFLVDYLFALAFTENIGGFREAVDALESNNPHVYDLGEMLGEPFDPAAYERLRTSDTYFYKLNRRYAQSTDTAGGGTFFDALRAEMLGCQQETGPGTQSSSSLLSSQRER